MNQITIDNILLVEVPEDATDFMLHEIDDYMKIVFTSQIQDPCNCGGDMLKLPAGNWQFIGTSDAITEEMAAKIVDYECKPNSFTSFRYRNYEWNWGLPQFFPTALESYQSWLRANSININNRYAILKKL